MRSFSIVAGSICASLQRTKKENTSVFTYDSARMSSRKNNTQWAHPLSKLLKYLSLPCISGKSVINFPTELLRCYRCLMVWWRLTFIMEIPDFTLVILSDRNDPCNTKFSLHLEWNSWWIFKLMLPCIEMQCYILLLLKKIIHYQFIY